MEWRAALSCRRVLRRWPRTDTQALAVVFASLAVGIALTWQRWGNPLIDCGREMNQPLRLLRGERLCGDISHFYGPLAPTLNAALYRLFGISLDTLRWAGLAATLVILAVTYWIGRRVMGRAGAALAAVSVTWLCALSLAGNYILPYAYAAVYGTALSLAALAVGIAGVRSGSAASVLLSALLTALAFLAKTEMGAAALAGGLACALLSAAPHWRTTAWRVGAFLCLGLGLPAAAYAAYASQVGWAPLLDEGHLLYQHLALPIVTFNRRMFGLDRPWHSLLTMTAVTLRLALLATLVAWWAQRRSGVDRARRSRLGSAIVALTLAVLACSVAVGWQGGPYLAAPFVLLALIAFHGRRLWRQVRSPRMARGRAAIGFAVSLFALVSLGRMVLRVRSGGSYSAYALPASVVLFTYAWCALLPALMPCAAPRRLVRVAGLLALASWIAGAAVTTVVRQRALNTATLATPRGTMVTTPAIQRAFAQAIDTIESRTQPGDLVAVVPEGTALLFFTDRGNPLHEEMTVPGCLNEDRAIVSLTQKPVALVLVVNRATPEYGPAHFGADYAQRLMRLIEERFVPCGRFGDRDKDARLTPALAFSAFCRR